MELVRVPDLSVGIYVLAPGDVDLQQPRGEDEVYYVIEGRARVTVGQEVTTVHTGSLLFVAAGVPHRFHDIEQDLVVLVVFGPSEGSRGSG